MWEECPEVIIVQILWKRKVCAFSFVWTYMAPTRVSFQSMSAQKTGLQKYRYFKIQLMLLYRNTHLHNDVTAESLCSEHVWAETRRPDNHNTATQRVHDVGTPRSRISESNWTILSLHPTSYLLFVWFSHSPLSGLEKKTWSLDG